MIGWLVMPDLDPDFQKTQELLSAFASIARQGLILLTGESAFAYHAAVILGMDAMTRLIVNLHSDALQQPGEERLQADLRVAVHRQNPEEFLDDVSRHSLNLVVIGSDALTPRLASQIQNMLSDGGCLIVLQSREQMDPSILEQLNDCQVADILSFTLFVKATWRRPPVRRGGRRANITRKSD